MQWTYVQHKFIVHICSFEFLSCNYLLAISIATKCIYWFKNLSDSFVIILRNDWFCLSQAQHNVSLSSKFNPEEVLEQIKKTIDRKQIKYAQYGWVALVLPT